MQYTLDFSESKKLEDAMKLVPNRSEKLVNDYLHAVGAKEMMNAIIGFIPISKRNKRHAKTSSPLKMDKLNLGFKIYPKGGAANRKNSFGYLVFPNDGIGGKNKNAHQFFETGAKAIENKILDDVLVELEKAIKI